MTPEAEKRMVFLGSFGVALCVILALLAMAASLGH